MLLIIVAILFMVFWKGINNEHEVIAIIALVIMMTILVLYVLKIWSELGGFFV